MNIKKITLLLDSHAHNLSNHISYTIDFLNSKISSQLLVRECSCRFLTILKNIQGFSQSSSYPRSHRYAAGTPAVAKWERDVIDIDYRRAFTLARPTNSRERRFSGCSGYLFASDRPCFLMPRTTEPLPRRKLYGSPSPMFPSLVPSDLKCV